MRQFLLKNCMVIIHKNTCIFLSSPSNRDTASVPDFHSGSAFAGFSPQFIFSAEHARCHRLELLKDANKLRVTGIADLQRDFLDILRAAADQFLCAIRT